MLEFTIERPNTTGVTYHEEFEKYSDLEPWLERFIEIRADKGWQFSELKGSSSKSGTIEGVHEDVADVMLLRWRTH